MFGASAAFGTIGLTELVVVLFIATLTLFWMWMLCDAVGNGNLTTRERRFWVVVMALTHAIGAMSYLLNRPRPGTGGRLAKNPRPFVY